MTSQKSFKSRVRARMEKTGESYTTARRQLLAKAADPLTPPAEQPVAPAVEQPVAQPAEQPVAPAVEQPVAQPAEQPVAPAAELAATPVSAVPGARRPYSDEVIQANTGRTWNEWFALLDAWGAAERPHPEIARFVATEHGVGGWWAQGVTVAYEQARGLRAPGQRRGGDFEVNASKTVAVPVERLFEAFTDEGLRERWLPGAKLEIRTAQPAKSIRADWDDGSTRLALYFTARGDAKSQVALVHQRVPDAATAATLKAFWRERVAVLKQVLET